MGKNKILVVDEEKSITENFKEILETEGCEAFGALTTPEAWEIFQRERPDTCVIEIIMGNSPYNGLELLRKIRQIDKKARCFILTSGLFDKREEAEEIGIEGYYEKCLGGDDYDKFIKKLTGD